MDDFFESLQEVREELRNEDDVPDRAWTARDWADENGITYDSAKDELNRWVEDGKLESGHKYARNDRGHEQRLKHYWPAE